MYSTITLQNIHHIPMLNCKEYDHKLTSTGNYSFINCYSLMNNLSKGYCTLDYSYISVRPTMFSDIPMPISQGATKNLVTLLMISQVVLFILIILLNMINEIQPTKIILKIICTKSNLSFLCLNPCLIISDYDIFEVLNNRPLNTQSNYTRT